MKFTPSEWEVLLHRLGAPDAIAEALTDDRMDGSAPSHGYSYDEIELRAMDLAKCGGVLDAFDDDLTRLIILDCAEGSTFMCGANDAVAQGEATRGEILAQLKAINRLEEKLGVEIPRN